MDIDFTSLSFKIAPPHKLHLDDTREDEESTANPFKRTSKLFRNNKTIESGLDLYCANSTRYVARDSNENSRAAAEQQIFSLENFESFKENQKLFPNQTSNLRNESNPFRIDKNNNFYNPSESSSNLSFLVDDSEDLEPPKFKVA